jgi:hypothetical protein
VRYPSLAYVTPGFTPTNTSNVGLVGGFNPSEKYQSVGMIVPNIWKTKNHVPTTNQR